MDEKNLEEMEELDSIVVLNDENGNEVSFEYLDLIEYQGAEYVVLLPVEENEDDGVVILRVEAIDGNDEEENYVSVEDEQTLLAVYGIFREHFADEFDFQDETQE